MSSFTGMINNRAILQNSGPVFTPHKIPWNISHVKFSKEYSTCNPMEFHEKFMWYKTGTAILQDR